jgi:hypothetical protein
MFVGAQLAHLGERAREARQRPRAAFGFGALPGFDVMTADDHFDLRQFAFHRAGHALDQRDAGSGRWIVRAHGGGTPAEHLPLGDRGARRLILRIDRDRFGTDVHPVGGQRLLALLDRGVAFAFQGPAGFRFRGFLRGTLARNFFCGRLFSTHTRSSHRFRYRSD